ncbi:transcriptional regulator, MarR family protein [Stappia aggregata IAM 12614]|uniref:Transcriptional regulator, MarR family protein n=1 Tax=Roseibium aggregatum (strain ATCC 25650 / DSM 13394 / JCM 20685 / NBRC 16684 / NCIMB 2208 / IAM 12614 / B1) TaxID=384765 RepID=A0NYF0_ROSAI|nr:MarR family transcriptional regulator [Roseibium aggregatum]EAV42146.1 transcriptional regulator, MarR family protein [Stappia aggregata IAM 12614] [Roseibium aggregatum IAM 12614]
MAEKSELWLKLIQVVANIEAELGRTLQEQHGVGLSDYRALQILSRSPDSELRMQELASYLRLNQSSVSRMVERLERHGLTIRDLCPDDKRGVYTVLTDKGRSRLESAQPDYEAALTAALKEHGCEELLSTKFGTAETK